MLCAQIYIGKKLDRARTAPSPSGLTPPPFIPPNPGQTSACITKRWTMTTMIGYSVLFVFVIPHSVLAILSAFLAILHFAILHLAIPYLAIPYLAIPYLAIPYLAIPYLASYALLLVPCFLCLASCALLPVPCTLHLACCTLLPMPRSCTLLLAPCFQHLDSAHLNFTLTDLILCISFTEETETVFL